MPRGYPIFAPYLDLLGATPSEQQRTLPSTSRGANAEGNVAETKRHPQTTRDNSATKSAVVKTAALRTVVPEEIDKDDASPERKPPARPPRKPVVEDALDVLNAPSEYPPEVAPTSWFQRLRGVFGRQ